MGVGVHTQTLEALQVWGAVQVLQVYVPPQPFETTPHFAMQAVELGVGTHWQVVAGVPMQASVLAQGVQRAGSAHPLLASAGTHLSPHLLVPAPHAPITHTDP